MTVYGSEPRQGRMHPAVLALAGLAVLAVVVAGGFVLFGGSDDAPPPAAVAPPSSAAPRPSAAVSSPAPAKLTAGSWLLSPKGDPGKYLTVADEFATFSADERLVLTVSNGLADDACFSFREPGGRYLRHFDYRLRFDTREDADLFRADATFCPVKGAPAGTVRLQSKNYPDHVLHRRDGALYIDEPDDSAGFTADSSFVVRPA